MATTTTTPPSLPSPPSQSGGGSTSSTAVNIILSFLALICVPILIYAIFFCLKCPPGTVEWRRRRNSSDHTEVDGKAAHMDLIYKCSKQKKKKMEGENDDVDYDGECPVCLSMYVDGDEVRELNVCKHRFHVSCINKWLVSHNNCPVCRASVRGSKQRVSLSMAAAAADDLRQGLPDSSSMV